MKYKYKDIDGNHFVLDRSHLDNELYIAECSALAFHKSLIGLSELETLEKLKDLKNAGGLRISRAINTYYVVYHIFTSLMLIDDSYSINLPPNICGDNGYVDIEISFNDLNNPCELPKSWNESGKLEQDLATRITHRDIQSYCRKLRNNPTILDEPYKLLYDNFIYCDSSTPNKCIQGLYEKLYYVRNRSIYRPSNVIDINGGFIQTSKDVRKEIDDLPTSIELFNILQQIYLEIMKKSKKKGPNIYRYFITNFWGSHISIEREFLYDLGYTDEEINQIKFMKNFNREDLTFSSYITQLIELVNKDRLFDNLGSIWGKLIDITMDYDNTDKWYY